MIIKLKKEEGEEKEEGKGLERIIVKKANAF
jgi:hypothetical protein